MFAFKFSFVLTILAFFFMTATALPIVGRSGEAGAPVSLLGRTYIQRAVDGVASAPHAAREHLAPIARSPVPAADSAESFKPMKRSERFQRRVSGRSRLSSDALLDTQN